MTPSEMEWVHVTRTVKEMAPLLKGVGLQVATKLLRTRLSVKESMLRELPAELQVWNG